MELIYKLQLWICGCTIIQYHIMKTLKMWHFDQALHITTSTASNLPGLLACTAVPWITCTAAHKEHHSVTSGKTETEHIANTKHRQSN